MLWGVFGALTRWAWIKGKNAGPLKKRIRKATRKPPENKKKTIRLISKTMKRKREREREREREERNRKE